METGTKPAKRHWRNGPFRLGAFLVEPQRNRISGPAGAASLQPKVIDVLCALAERPGQVLSRAELIDAVWGVEHGADESLTRAISLLRKALGDVRSEPQVIETVAKRGYRLVVPATPAPAEAEPPAPSRSARPLWRFGAAAAALLLLGAAALLMRATPAPAHVDRGGIELTIRAFETLSSDREQRLIAARLAEDLRAAVARMPHLRTEADRPAAPDMRYVLQGDVRRLGDRLSVNVRLVDARTGAYVWAERYERPFDRQFSERERFIAAIAAELQPPLLRHVKVKLRAKPVMSLIPWELVLLTTWVPGDEERPAGPPSEAAYWLQNRALEIAPDFAPAHAMLAEVIAYHALFDPPSNRPSALARARRHAERAVELAPYDAEVLYHIATYYRFVGDRARAEATFRRVLELQPTYLLARINLESIAGQCSERAVAAARRLSALERTLSAANPARWVVLSELSALHLGSGDARAAADAARRSRQIVQTMWTATTLAAADVELGNRAEARSVLDQHRREWPNIDMGYFADRIVPRWCLGGPQTAAVQARFHRLAAALAQPG